MAGSALLASGPLGARHDATGRALAFEPLEQRMALSAAGLIEVGTQPEGALSGKIVYTHAGHGITANPNGTWSFQRPLLLDMVEDLGNQDQMSFLVDYLFRAGATVVPIRPVGHQPLEVVLDNDDPGVTFSGSWSNSSSSVYFGSPGDVPYRFASTSANETAYARYQPNIPASDFYPVYAWTRSGSDRVPDQLYRVHHSGGITEVTVNHQRVGNGLVYLGTYYFEAGSEGYVDISNRSDTPGVVIADMIRFGNGMGDINRGAGVSGLPREDEAGLYWVEWHVSRSQGIPTSEYRATNDDRDATVSLSPRWAEFMNREADGALSDRLFVSFHSNAGSGSNRGVLGLYNGNNNPNTATPNQFLLANTLGRELNDDMVAQNGQFEHNWFNRTTVTLDRSDIEFGEINNLRINDEFDATIVETAFHDNQLDAELMRDPKARDAMARATYQGIVRYFNTVDGGATQVIMAPGAVTHVRAQSTEAGSVTMSWTPPAANVYNGDAPTGYRIYTSADGYGFDGGRDVSGGGTTTHTITGLDENAAYYFKVVAVNDGGESPGSEVVAAIANGEDHKVLIVGGFDRFDRFMNPLESVPGGLAQRLWTRHSNSFDYSVQVAEAIEAASLSAAVDSASNEAVISGAVELTDYDSVVWILGEESSGDATFDSTEQALVTAFVAAGGNLFLSGTEIGWDLDNLNNGRTFYNDVLHADYVSDDANTYNVAGVAGSIFEGLALSFDDGTQFYDANFPDVISPQGGAIAALNYSGGTGGTAAIQHGGDVGQGRIVMLAFPFETITTAANRAAVMDRVLTFFSLPTVPTVTLEFILDDNQGPPTYTESAAWQTSSSQGFNGGTYQFTSAGEPLTATWQFEAPASGPAEVFVQYAAGLNRTNSAVYHIDTGTTVVDRSISQQQNGLEWVSLGTFFFAEGTRHITIDAGASSGGGIVVADAVRILLTVPAQHSGDYNGDGVVNGPDFILWRNTLGQQVEPGSGADGNFDGEINQPDYDLWKANFGTVIGQGEASALPVAAPATSQLAPRTSPRSEPTSVYDSWDALSQNALDDEPDSAGLHADLSVWDEALSEFAPARTSRRQPSDDVTVIVQDLPHQAASNVSALLSLRQRRAVPDEPGRESSPARPQSPWNPLEVRPAQPWHQVGQLPR